jgi:hypothetical protein
MQQLISNSGEIERGALTLLGASSKRDDETKIGFFGSGVKYAIAVLMRKGNGIRVFSGLREIAIEKKEVTFRDTAFNQIFIDGEATSLTTEMGPTWDTWFAVREIVCNAMDEPSYYTVTTEDDDIRGEEGKTRIFIERTEDVAEFFDSLDDYIVQTTPFFITSVKDNTSAMCAIYPQNNDDKFILYRKKVRVSEKTTSEHSLFRYGLDNVSINESRIAYNDWEIRNEIARLLARCSNEDIVTTVIKNIMNKHYIESEVYWQYVSCSDYNESWEHVLRGFSIYPQSMVAYLPEDDIAKGIVLPDYLSDRLSERFPSLLVYDRKGRAYKEIDDEDVPQNLLDNLLRARDEVLSFGYAHASSQYKIVDFFYPNVVAQALPSSHTVLYSINYLEDYDELVATVIEEACHLDGFKDGSRDFEQALMRRIVRACRAEQRWNAIKTFLNGR